MKRKRHLLDNQINVNLLTKIYFSVIFFISHQIKKYLQSTRAPFFAILVRSYRGSFRSNRRCFRSVLDVSFLFKASVRSLYTKKGHQHFGDLF